MRSSSLRKGFELDIDFCPSHFVQGNYAVKHKTANSGRLFRPFRRDMCTRHSRKGFRMGSDEIGSKGGFPLLLPKYGADGYRISSAHSTLGGSVMYMIGDVHEMKV